MQINTSYSSYSSISPASQSSTAASADFSDELADYEKRTGFHGLGQLTGDISALFSPDTRNALYETQLNQMNLAPEDRHFLTGMEFLARSYVDPSINEVHSATPDTVHWESKLTDDDLAYMKKITGYNLIVGEGGSTAWLDDNGNFPDPKDSEMLKEAGRLADQIDIDRHVGTLKGGITRDYIEKLFGRARQAGAAYDPAFEQRVLEKM
jgi:hypothetical protein